MIIRCASSGASCCCRSSSDTGTWKDEQEQLLPGHDGNSNIVYDEAGTLHCYDRASAPMVRHRMSYIGHEPSRGTLKYRCPAMHED